MIIQDLYLSDTLDFDNEMKISFYDDSQSDIWINKSKAVELINHLIQTFDIDIDDIQS